jgi:hypothetical protein
MKRARARKTPAGQTLVEIFDGVDPSDLTDTQAGIDAITANVAAYERPKFSLRALDAMERDGWTPGQVRELIADYRRLAAKGVSK